MFPLPVGWAVGMEGGEKRRGFIMKERRRGGFRWTGCALSVWSDLLENRQKAGKKRERRRASAASGPEAWASLTLSLSLPREANH
jgi:hypothetical protein